LVSAGDEGDEASRWLSAHVPLRPASRLNRCRSMADFFFFFLPEPGTEPGTEPLAGCCAGCDESEGGRLEVKESTLPKSTMTPLSRLGTASTLPTWPHSPFNTQSTGSPT